jgi:hypothetical protein
MQIKAAISLVIPLIVLLRQNVKTSVTIVTLTLCYVHLVAQILHFVPLNSLAPLLPCARVFHAPLNLVHKSAQSPHLEFKCTAVVKTFAWSLAQMMLLAQYLASIAGLVKPRPTTCAWHSVHHKLIAQLWTLSHTVMLVALVAIANASGLALHMKAIQSMVASYALATRNVHQQMVFVNQLPAMELIPKAYASTQTSVNLALMTHQLEFAQSAMTAPKLPPVLQATATMECVTLALLAKSVKQHILTTTGVMSTLVLVTKPTPHAPIVQTLQLAQQQTT